MSRLIFGRGLYSRKIRMLLNWPPLKAQGRETKALAVGRRVRVRGECDPQDLDMSELSPRRLYSLRNLKPFNEGFFSVCCG